MITFCVATCRVKHAGTCVVFTVVSRVCYLMKLFSCSLHYDIIMISNMKYLYNADCAIAIDSWVLLLLLLIWFACATWFVVLLPRYGRFRFFKMAAVRHLRFFNVKNVNCQSASQLGRVNICVTVPNFVLISQTVAKIWPFFDFFWDAAVRHLGFDLRVFGPPTKIS